MKRFIMIAICLLPLACLSGEWIEDPSAVPLLHDDGQSAERYRILADINGDGIMDMALSCSISLFGNAGGHFTVYIQNEDGRFRRLGEFFGHPMALALERVGEKVRLWTYVRGGGWLGKIGYHEVTEEGLSGYHGVVIHPGDSGTKMGNAIYGAVMTNSDLPIMVERSQTADGKVEWTNPHRVAGD